MLFYPTAIGWHPAEKEQFGEAQYDAWQTIQRAHAIANGVYVAAVNRVGHEHGDIRGNRAPGVGLEFWGGSFIADPFGRVLAQAPHDSEAILIEEVDLKYSRIRGATGRSCATGASISIRPLRRAFLTMPVNHEHRARQGYRMPAEWEPHAATWLAWPHNAEDWPGRFHPIPWVYCDIIRHLTRVEDVHLLVNNAAAEQRARGMLAKVGANVNKVHFHQWPTNRVWMRDSGSDLRHEAHRNAVAITDWRFNAWAKYRGLAARRPAAARRRRSCFRSRSWSPEFAWRGHRVVLEGGSIDVNGRGTLITTEECLLSDVQQRNPALSREDLERVFHDYLGIDQVLWMDRGIAGDDTHGHVDDITRFVGPDTIVTVVEPNHGR